MSRLPYELHREPAREPWTNLILRQETRATIEVHQFFSNTTPSIWELKTSSPKAGFGEKNKNCYQMKNPMAWVHHENHAEKKYQPIISNDFGLKILVTQKPFFAKKRYTSIVSTHPLSLRAPCSLEETQYLCHSLSSR